MRYFLSLISIALAHMIFFGFVYAENTTDITKSDYKIPLNALDPFNSSANTSVGKAALVGEEGATQLGGLLGKIADILFFAIPIIAVISLIIAGYYYILSSGDSEKTSQAKTIIKWNLIAIMVALLSYTMIYLIAKMLDGTLF